MDHGRRDTDGFEHAISGVRGTHAAGRAEVEHPGGTAGVTEPAAGSGRPPGPDRRPEGHRLAETGRYAETDRSPDADRCAEAGRRAGMDRAPDAGRSPGDRFAGAGRLAGADRVAGRDGFAGAHYDVVIAGGGPAGSAAALALARAGRRVLLADGGTGPPAIGEALPSVTRTVLRDLGVADVVPGDGHLPCYANLSAWGSPLLASVDAINDPHGPGLHLDRALFDRRLRNAARDAGADLAERVTVRPVAHGSDGHWVLTLRQPRSVGGPGARVTDRPSVCGREVRGRLLVDATGRRAAIAIARGARRHTYDRLTATCLTFGAGGGREDTSTLVEAVEDGWWYTALLPSGARIVIRFADAQPVTTTRNDAREAFTAGLARTRHVAPRVAGHPLPPGAVPRRAPAHTSRLDAVHGDGWVAVGDAAAAFDPLSSQGILTALYTGMAAGRAVHAHLDGDRHALSGYAAEVTGIITAYLRNRHAFHLLEQRWPERPFWHRRHAPPQGVRGV